MFVRRHFSPVCLVILLAAVSLFAPSAFAGDALPDALQFFKNYFVTGDYVSAGVGLQGQGVVNTSLQNLFGQNGSFATNNITVTGIPANADIVAAYLYWETVEKTATPSSNNGYFGYSIGSVPPPGTLGTVTYPIAGKALGLNPNQSTPPCWSSGGGTGTSQGAAAPRVYRADVRPYLPIVGGRAVAGSVTFTVSLPDSGSTGNGVPLTQGASLVIVYRVISPSVPLKSIVIYDGAYTMNNAQPFMNQTIRGFYDALANSTPGSARLTHIVGAGQANKTEELYFQNSPQKNNPFTGIGNATQLPDWDNFTLDVSPLVDAKLNPLLGTGAAWVTTSVQQISSTTDCLNWGAVVFSTLVESSDNDGLLNVWKTSQGYAGFPWFAADKDPGDGSWVPLTGAKQSEVDLFVQIDYLCSGTVSTTGVCTPGDHPSHLPPYDALKMIGDAFRGANTPYGNQTTSSDGPGPIHVFFDVGNNYQSHNLNNETNGYILPFVEKKPSGGNAIAESSLSCTPSSTVVCAFPNQPVVSWKGGFDSLKNTYFQPVNGAQSITHPRKDSYHYVLFGHSLALATTSWSEALGTLSQISVKSGVATVTTIGPNGLTTNATDPTLNPVVTISGALADFDLNRSYVVQSVPKDACGVAPQSCSFTVNTPNVTDGTYNNWGLAVSTGPAKSTSGWSDLLGGDTIITLGQWTSDNPAENQVGSVQVQAGTLMHELGHTLGLTHAGPYSTLAAKGFEPNCKPNYESVMNYLFQIRGLTDFGTPTTVHVDYSGGTLPSLLEGTLDESTGLGSSALYQTRWFAPFGSNFLNSVMQSTGNTKATRHCNGTPLNPSDPQPDMVRVDQFSSQLLAPALDWNMNNVLDSTVAQDLNFNGVRPDSTLNDYSDWANLDLRQMGARRNALGFSGDVLGGGGGDLLGGGGGDLLGGGGGDLLGGGGGDLLGGGGGDLLGGGGGEQVNDFDLANSSVDPPQNVVATQTAKKTVTVTWFPPNFGQIRKYYVWQATITKVPMSSTNPPVNLTPKGIDALPIPNPLPYSYSDNTVGTNNIYQYFVSGALGNGNQSAPSNVVTITVK